MVLTRYPYPGIPLYPDTPGGVVVPRGITFQYFLKFTEFHVPIGYQVLEYGYPRVHRNERRGSLAAS